MGKRESAARERTGWNKRAGWRTWAGAAAGLMVWSAAVLGQTLGQTPGQTPGQGSGGAACAAPVKIVAFGDSLTAGYLLPEAAAFPAVLERRLRALGYCVRIENAGVSGDTTGAGLERLDWSTPEDTKLALVELGANDMLRGLDPAISRRNLEAVAARLAERKIPFVLSGMKSIANWGPERQRAFDDIFIDLSKKYDAPLYPFFLEGVYDQPQLKLADGLHPNAAGVERIVDGFAPFLADVLRRKLGLSPTGAR